MGNKTEPKCPEPGCNHPVSEHRDTGGCMNTRRRKDTGALIFCGCTRTFR